jgi:hypothetical protein
MFDPWFVPYPKLVRELLLQDLVKALFTLAGFGGDGVWDYLSHGFLFPKVGAAGEGGPD